MCPETKTECHLLWEIQCTEQRIANKGISKIKIKLGNFYFMKKINQNVKKSDNICTTKSSRSSHKEKYTNL